MNGGRYAIAITQLVCTILILLSEHNRSVGISLHFDFQPLKIVINKIIIIFNLSEFCYFPVPLFRFLQLPHSFPCLRLPYAHLSPSASASLLLPFFCLCPSRLHQSFSGIFAAAYLFLLLCPSSIFILYFISSHPLCPVSFSNNGFLSFPFDVQVYHAL